MLKRASHRFVSIFVISLLGLSACVHTAFEQPAVQRPENEQIWSVADGQFISPSELYQRLLKSQFVLLGETHDNPMHHKLQTDVIRAMTLAGRKPILAMEQLNSDQAPKLAAYLKAHPNDASKLGLAVNWAGSGWPRYEIYQPIFAVAMAAELKIVPALFPNRKIRDIYRNGLSVLFSPSEIEALGLGLPLVDDDLESVKKVIRESHCNQLPESAIDPMIDIQRARDAMIAKTAMKAANAAEGAIIIAGAGHLRKDWAVPVYLKALDPKAQIVALAFTEVKDDAKIADVLTTEVKESFDYLWLTEPLERPDLCEVFREKMTHPERLAPSPKDR